MIGLGGRYRRAVGIKPSEVKSKAQWKIGGGRFSICDREALRFSGRNVNATAAKMQMNAAR